MHIVTAFETAQNNRDEACKEINQLAIDSIGKGDIESMAIAMKLQELNKKVMAILDPFTE